MTAWPHARLATAFPEDDVARFGQRRDDGPSQSDRHSHVNPPVGSQSVSKGGPALELHGGRPEQVSQVKVQLPYAWADALPAGCPARLLDPS